MTSYLIKIFEKFPKPNFFTHIGISIIYIFFFFFHRYLGKTLDYEDSIMYYNEFCEDFDISSDKSITEENFLDYFKKKKRSGMGSNAMQNLYSHLNKACYEVNGWNLNKKWPKIINFILHSSYSEGTEM